MSEKPYVAVIGGMNMDIFGIPALSTAFGWTTPKN